MQKKPSNRILPLLCASFLLVFALALLLTPQKAYSAEENRTLTTAPTFTLQSLTDGSYTRALGDYFSDQFPLRSAFVRLKAGCERLLLRGENNGVLFGKNGYLIARSDYTDAQYGALRQNLAALSQFSERVSASDVPLTVAPVPRSLDVNRLHLPAAYRHVDPDAVWSVWEACYAASLPTPVDLRTPLRQAADEGHAVWYKTDHHWTGEGAYLAYAALGESLGYTPYPAEAFTRQTVSTDFLGTTYSKAGLHAAEADTITLWRYDGDDTYRTEIWNNGAVSHTISGFYDNSALQDKDQYRIYLGGTQAQIRVLPPEGSDLPLLLIVKDSYAQSLAPLLARHFRLILIDPRSYRPSASQPGVVDLIRAEQPDAVLFLCGVDTLCGDVDLRTLLLGN